jgi:3-hydroxybutyryl-CoA dehydrogenase
MSTLISNSTMAVIGGGTMGVGIAYVHAAAGWTTWVVEPDQARTQAMMRTLRDTAQAGVKRLKFSQEQANDLMARVQTVTSIDQLPRDLPLVIESVPERAEIKARVLREIAARNPQLIASNTSSMSIDELSNSVADPACFLGMHFFNPVWSLHLVEIVQGERTSQASIERARQCAHSLGKQTILVRDVPGFATSRLDLITSLEAMRMVQDGVASAHDIDLAATTAYRHPMGPLRLSDVVGLDVRLDIAHHLAQTLGDRYAPPQILEEMVAKGHLGQKSGQGFYSWSDSN